MSTAPDLPSKFVIPRPGVLKTLGICHVVFAILGGFCVGSSLLFTIYASVAMPPPMTTAVKVEVQPPGKVAPAAGVSMSAGFNPFMGMQDQNFLRFCYIDNVIGLLMNLVMFITGIGLINRRSWAARGWGIMAWVRIVLICLTWSYYIVGVAPGFSETMAQEALKMYAAQGMAPAKMPPVGILTRVYSFMNLFMALGAMLVTSAYPAISIFFLSRPGVKAAIVDKPLLELDEL